MYDSINERIKYYRGQKKLSQTQLGEKLGMKCSTFSQMERQGNITVDIALEIARALEIDPDLIIYGYQKTPPIKFTPTKPQTVVAGTTTPFIDIYNKPTVDIEEEKEEKAVYILNPTEEGIIKTYRGLPKSKQKELYAFVNELDKK